MKTRTIIAALVIVLVAVGSTGILPQEDVGQWNILYSEGAPDSAGRDFWAGQGFALGCAIGAAGLGPAGIFVGSACAFGFAY